MHVDNTDDVRRVSINIVIYHLLNGLEASKSRKTFCMKTKKKRIKRNIFRTFLRLKSHCFDAHLFLFLFLVLIFSFFGPVFPLMWFGFRVQIAKKKQYRLGDKNFSKSCHRHAIRCMESHSRLSCASNYDFDIFIYSKSPVFFRLFLSFLFSLI